MLHVGTAVQPDPPASVALAVWVSFFAAVTTQIKGANRRLTCHLSQRKANSW